MKEKFPAFSYNPQELPRELKPFYLSATQEDIDAMLKSLDLSSLEELFDHIPSSIRMEKRFDVKKHLEYDELAQHLYDISCKNNNYVSFIGDGLPQYEVPDVVGPLCGLRGLTTAYTPYQPERSQGTLESLWIYAQSLKELTGFEAINASLYERSTCLFEAINCAYRLNRKKTLALVAGTIYPGDQEVLKTLTKNLDIEVEFIPANTKTGKLFPPEVETYIDKFKDRVFTLVFPQVNSFGNLEDVHELTDLAHKYKLTSIAMIDPIQLAEEGLMPPSQFGSQKEGVTMIVGEGQHLTLGPNFGGPGLGIFGIRYSQKEKTNIRQTAGRFVGEAQDYLGNLAKTLVLSTREQHIRRENATSNICSNQSFVATLFGGSLLARGNEGLKNSLQKSHHHATQMAKTLSSYPGVQLKFSESSFLNSFVLELPMEAKEFIAHGQKEKIHVGIDVSYRYDRTGATKNLLLLSFGDRHSSDDLKKLTDLFTKIFGSPEKEPTKLADIPDSLRRKTKTNLPNLSSEEIVKYYSELSEQNISPDLGPYPLGSCTMKYNPYINDHCASYPGFTDSHPQAPLEDIQGSLEILYEIQEIFKNITGLPAVTTQPVAGAQGELVGLKMFQAYHESHGEGETRDIILIPRSAHGTNPATATMVGYKTFKKDGKPHGIILIESSDDGEMDIEQVKKLVAEHGKRIAGVMVTNPNTAGIFEKNFKEMADLIHSVGGLVYMDGANMNAIAGYVDLGAMGVDAVHNNLHKTWTIPHGGGGPGDAIVAVSEKLIPYLPGTVVEKTNYGFITRTPQKTIGSIHRHFGNFAHKVRAYTYLKALGTEGILKMTEVAVLSARYLQKKLEKYFPTLPKNAESALRMHEFIITLPPDLFQTIQKTGIPKAQIIPLVGKLFLDFGLHAPTVAFPETLGLMVEPTESYSKTELDRFAEVLEAMFNMLSETPEVLLTTPHFTPVTKIDEVTANKNLVLSKEGFTLNKPIPNKVAPQKLAQMPVMDICKKILDEHHKMLSLKNNEK